MRKNRKTGWIQFHILQLKVFITEGFERKKKKDLKVKNIFLNLI